MIPTTAEFQNFAGMRVVQTLRSLHLNFPSSGRTTYNNAWEIRIPFNLQNLLEERIFFLIIPLPLNTKFSKLLSSDLLTPDGTPQTISFGKY